VALLDSEASDFVIRDEDQNALGAGRTRNRNIAEEPTYPEFRSFEGTFEQGKFTKGTVIYFDTSSWVGKMKDNAAFGEGVLTFRSQCKFEGSLVGSQMTRGRIVHSNGDSYTGTHHIFYVVSCSLKIVLYRSILTNPDS
jgi:hypothetical protein